MKIEGWFSDDQHTKRRRKKKEEREGEKLFISGFLVTFFAFFFRAKGAQIHFCGVREYLEPPNMSAGEEQEGDYITRFSRTIDYLPNRKEGLSHLQFEPKMLHLQI